MGKLVLVDGHSGSGKTTISKFLEKELGFQRYGFDDYITEFFSKPSGYSSSKEIDDLRLETERTTNFWQNFRRNKNYSLDQTLEILSKYKKDLENGLKIPLEYARIYLEAFWNCYFDLRDISLQTGNVVLDTVVERSVMPVIFDVNAKKYHVKLKADKEKSMQRKINQYGWTRQIAEDVITRTSGYIKNETTIPGVVLLEYENNTEEDLERIKSDLRLIL